MLAVGAVDGWSAGQQVSTTLDFFQFSFVAYVGCPVHAARTHNLFVSFKYQLHAEKGM